MKEQEKVSIAEHLITRWEDLPEWSEDKGKPVHEYLGLGDIEYSLVFEDKETLESMVRERNPEITRYILSRVKKTVLTLEDALTTLESKETADRRFMFAGEGEPFELDERYCSTRFIELLVSLSRIGDDMGWKFDEYHNLRNWVEAYIIILDAITYGKSTRTMPDTIFFDTMRSLHPDAKLLEIINEQEQQFLQERGINLN